MNCDSLYRIFDLVISLITGGVVGYFARKSYRLEKNNKFHGRGYLQKVNDIATGKEYIVASFLNEGNVEGYITEFFVEVSYHSFKEKLEVLLGKKEKYVFMLYQNDLFSEGMINQEKLPWDIEPRKRKIMYFDQDLFISELKNLKSIMGVDIKNFVFRDSTYNFYKYRITRKEFPELFK